MSARFDRDALGMRNRLLATLAWLGFSLVVVAGGYLALSACEFGLRPIFGFVYCQVPAEPDRLVAERDHARDLRGKIHKIELQIARLPKCAPRLAEATPKPPEPPKPEPVPEVLPPEPPKPEPVPEVTLPEPPKPEPMPEPVPKRADELVVPEKLADLKGCWQSVRGDLPMVTDDEEHRPLGQVRICYCFDNKGGGTVRYKYTNGARCTAPLKAKLAPGQLSFRHGRIPCTRKMGHVVPADIACQADTAGAAASCDRQTHGRFPSEQKGEKYHRVTDEYCR